MLLEPNDDLTVAETSAKAIIAIPETNMFLIVPAVILAAISEYSIIPVAIVFMPVINDCISVLSPNILADNPPEFGIVFAASVIAFIAKADNPIETISFIVIADTVVAYSIIPVASFFIPTTKESISFSPIIN